jgi:hypothetical protein
MGQNAVADGGHSLALGTEDAPYCVQAELERFQKLYSKREPSVPEAEFLVVAAQRAERLYGKAFSQLTQQVTTRAVASSVINESKNEVIHNLDRQIKSSGCARGRHLRNEQCMNTLKVAYPLLCMHSEKDLLVNSRFRYAALLCIMEIAMQVASANADRGRLMSDVWSGYSSVLRGTLLRLRDYTVMFKSRCPRHSLSTLSSSSSSCAPECRFGSDFERRRRTCACSTQRMNLMGSGYSLLVWLVSMQSHWQQVFLRHILGRAEIAEEKLSVSEAALKTSRSTSDKLQQGLERSGPS